MSCQYSLYEVRYEYCNDRRKTRQLNVVALSCDDACAVARKHMESEGHISIYSVNVLVGIDVIQGMEATR